MKYQIILESNKILADDEFEVGVKVMLRIAKERGLALGSFKLSEAQSLDGIREEAYACEAMKRVAVKDLQDWEKEHDVHLKRGKKYEVSGVARHPTNGMIDKISCPCGKSIIAFRQKVIKDALD